MFRHILLATDLSNASGRALSFAATLARSHGARLTVLHVYEASASSLAGTTTALAERTWPGVIRAREELDQLVRAVQAAGTRAQATIALGIPPILIAEIAREEQADLVVTGTHGRGGLARLFFGSVAEQVIRLSKVPVVAVPMGASVIDIQSRRAAAARRCGHPGGSGSQG
jgi:nucleotide-binding universal stress UspA family protein